MLILLLQTALGSGMVEFGIERLRTFLMANAVIFCECGLLLWRGIIIITITVKEKEQQQHWLLGYTLLSLPQRQQHHAKTRAKP